MHRLQGTRRTGDSTLTPKAWPDVAPGAARRSRAATAAAALGTAALDQGVKAAVTATMAPGESLPLAGRLLSLTHVQNTGVAFGLLAGIPPVVTLLAALTLFVILFYNKGRWPRTRVEGAAIALMAGGAAGNLIDRVRLGFVIDYLDVHIWPVFNLADTAIVVGAGLLVVALARDGRAAHSRR